VAFLTDISKSGFLMVTEGSEILPGTAANFSFRIPERKEYLIVRGKIVRTLKGENARHHLSGVKFCDTPESDIETLFDYALKRR